MKNKDKQSKLVFWIKISLAFATICIVSFLIYDNYYEEKEDVKYRIGAIGNRYTSLVEPLEGKGTIYIENGQIIYRNKIDKIKIEAKGIEEDAMFITSLTSCSQDVFIIAVITENNNVYINKHKSMDFTFDEKSGSFSNATLYLDFLKVEYDILDIPLVGIEATFPKIITSCETQELFVYDSAGTRRIVEYTTKEGQIVNAKVGDTWETLYPYKDLFDYSSDSAVAIFKDNTIAIIENYFNEYKYINERYSYITNEKDEKIKIKDMFVTEKLNDEEIEDEYIIDSLYIRDEKNKLYKIELDSVNVHSPKIVAKKYNDKEIKLIRNEKGKIVNIEYTDGTKDTINNSIIYKK